MEWDTIIVGAGSSGCVLAARLSEEPGHRVLLLEAGPDFDPNELPEQVEYLGRGYQWPIEWGEEVASSDGRTLPYLRGRGVGGSSSINGGVAMRAEPDDLENWPAGWKWEDMLPWFCMLENDLDYGSEAWHGDAGPIPIRRWHEEEWDPTQKAFTEACSKLGIAECRDHNAPDTTGVGPIPMNRDGKRRLSAALTHLAAARARDELVVRGDTLVQRILLDGNSARGVELQDGERLEAGRVIVAAGVLQSPLLLWRSGIGPADALEGLGVSVVADSPGVGAAWTDHMVIQLSTPIEERWIRRGARGIQTLARITAPDSRFTNDLQLTPWVERMPDAGYRLNLSVSLQQPYGEASVRATNLDARERGAFDWAFPSEGRNTERLRFGYRRGAEILNASGVSSDAAALDAAASAADDEIDRWIAVNHGAFYHGAGSCRIGAEDSSPLGLRCEVRGAENLFVVDASSIPRVPRSNTHLLVVALAERVAALLRGTTSL